jgi:hypothetical protein
VCRKDVNWITNGNFLVGFRMDRQRMAAQQATAMNAPAAVSSRLLSEASRHITPDPTSIDARDRAHAYRSAEKRIGSTIQ